MSQRTKKVSNYTAKCSNPRKCTAINACSGVTTYYGHINNRDKKQTTRITTGTNADEYDQEKKFCCCDGTFHYWGENMNINITGENNPILEISANNIICGTGADAGMGLESYGLGKILVRSDTGSAYFSSACTVENGMGNWIQLGVSGDGLRGPRGYQGATGIMGHTGTMGVDGSTGPQGPPGVGASGTLFYVETSDAPSGGSGSGLFPVEYGDTLRIWSAGGIEAFVATGSVRIQIEPNNILITEVTPPPIPKDRSRPVIYINSNTEELIAWIPDSNGGTFASEISGGGGGTPGATGPQGHTGAQGFRGATGSGIAGPQGHTGAQGSDGLDGATGVDGPQGHTGAQGSDGLDGVTGIDGPQGHTGAQGSDGLDGVTGIDGPQGHTGAQGSDGLDGATGIDGPQGHTGAQGSQGHTGAQGPIGVTGSFAGTSITDLSDVNTSMAATGDILQFNGIEWSPLSEIYFEVPLSGNFSPSGWISFDTGRLAGMSGATGAYKENGGFILLSSTERGLNTVLQVPDAGHYAFTLFGRLINPTSVHTVTRKQLLWLEDLPETNTVVGNSIEFTHISHPFYDANVFYIDNPDEVGLAAKLQPTNADLEINPLFPSKMVVKKLDF